MADAVRETILLVEDDKAMARIMGAALKARGYRVVPAATGKAALASAQRDNPAVVLLDLGLPDVDGIDVCKQLRSWSTVPIIVVTADGADDRKVMALDEGADDYVTKPFSTPELLARIRVALRHRKAAGLIDRSTIDVGDLHVDVARREVQVAGRVIDLAPKEFALLTLLARHAGRVLTHRAILEEVWGADAVRETQHLRVYAGMLRKKLGDDPARPRLVTAPGVGYRLVDPDEPAEDD
ncbi:MAG TPA: response regulator transcription factor [Acidimicrobiales bacterium]|nr:response regulator transcription factor [Acidimicrobiales bacterium]